MYLPSLGPIGSYGDATDRKGFLSSEPYRVPFMYYEVRQRSLSSALVRKVFEDGHYIVTESVAVDTI